MTIKVIEFIDAGMAVGGRQVKFGYGKCVMILCITCNMGAKIYCDNPNAIRDRLARKLFKKKGWTIIYNGKGHTMCPKCINEGRADEFRKDTHLKDAPNGLA